jgi:hypothetical protein
MSVIVKHNLTILQSLSTKEELKEYPTYTNGLSAICNENTAGHPIHGWSYPHSSEEIPIS